MRCVILRLASATLTIGLCSSSAWSDRRLGAGRQGLGPVRHGNARARIPRLGWAKRP